jgi:membrane-bound lytic murein transglycosylase D
VARVKKRYAVLLGLTLFAMPVAEGQVTPDPLEQWAEIASGLARDYLDPAFLQALEKGDRQVIERFLQQLSSEFGSDYVLNLVDLEETAFAAVKVMEQYEETVAYAAWLRPRLDYFKVARKLKPPGPPPKPPSGTPPPVPVNPSAFRQREAWMEQLSKEPPPARAKPHLADLKRIFHEQKVPQELVWIAEVESSFDSRARSPAGAAGMFQLMPATARRFGLASLPLDERYRVGPSATAAAKYLRFLHGKFKDWRLAVAAYNAGEGRVAGLLERGKATTYDAIASQLPAETQLYVPKVEATLLRREGVRLQDLKGSSQMNPLVH